MPIALSLIAPAGASASSTKVVNLKPVDGHGALIAGFTAAKTVVGRLMLVCGHHVGL